METIHFDGPLEPTPRNPVLIVALDGWTDAGRAGTLAAEALLQQWPGERIATLDADLLYDYRDRRPILTIDRGLLGDPVWPAMQLHRLAPDDGRDVLLLHGAEPDFGWKRLCADLADLAARTGAARYVGLGSVPAPAPHTRPTRVIATGSDEATLERHGRPHERLTVPASCQVVIEAALRDAGLVTLGLWARIPHYVAGDYPAGAEALLRHLPDGLGTSLDLGALEAEAEAHRHRLDLAASNSQEVVAHIRQLEQTYDQDVGDSGGLSPLPSGEEIAEELERFLRDQSGGR